MSSSTKSHESSSAEGGTPANKAYAADVTHAQTEVDVRSVAGSDEAELARMGYRQEFKREFTNLSTISFAFSIMGVASSVATTFGSFMCFCLGTSIAGLSHFSGATFKVARMADIHQMITDPTNGGLYSASAYLVPRKYKAITGWVVGWLNLLGQVAGVASTEYGLAQMILSAASLSTEGRFVATTGQTYAVFLGLLIIHGLINSAGTRFLAKVTQTFVFCNLGSCLAIIIALLVTTKEKHTASYVFTSTINGSGWSSQGLVFLLGLLSVQWTMTDYDATAHISEEVKRASIAAPVAIFVAVIGTGIVGWIYNVVYVLCSGDISRFDGSIYAPAQIIFDNVGPRGFYALWTFVCLTAFQVVATAMQANARTFHAFSRDHGLPDRGLFARLSKQRIPVFSVWLVAFISALMVLLSFASIVAVYAVFALCAMALDTSYVIPIALKMWFRDHPEVNYKPGPFDLGRGPLMYIINFVAIFWTTFVVIILALPTIMPVTAANMNYASAVTGGVMILSLIWYFAGGRKHYTGPRNLIQEELERAHGTVDGTEYTNEHKV
ncbi:BZ3500_MvSof-1268-A1-R1_Chr3-2g06340 [Microbotryum saponariae]|uniref:BZ3500_MvSof-1268-A1-R1_Chr3-2g06340 protein n=1 Tax=Microbotryum saponariae TaxID=289078 RepID=A0A2X0LQB7_9BASI|nr:BZ3500_MvSof-1268-A1-R1_Chr3-2g06340 [Microbotryum saponariae]SDA04311.1 BZ3501_MvSof-1269-A2-R1_Chr3-2g06031 [Microbotryum saponariae]